MSSHARDRTLPAFRAMMEVCSRGDDLSFARYVEMLRSASRASSPPAPGQDPSNSHVAQILSRHAGPEPDFPAHAKDPSGKSVAKDVARAGMLKSCSWTEPLRRLDPVSAACCLPAAEQGPSRAARAGAMRKSRSCVSFSSDIQLREFDAVPGMRKSRSCVTFSSDIAVRQFRYDEEPATSGPGRWR
jgi:hypothetical protein